MPMQPRPISETSSPALPRFRDLMVPPISRWPASGGRFVRVGHREQVAHGTQPDLPLAQVVASVVVVALDLPVHVDRGDAVLGDEVLLDRSRRVEEDGFRSDVGPEHIVRLGALLRAAVPAARPRPSCLVDPLPGPAALAGPCGVHVHGSSIAVERSGVVTASAHLTFRLAAIFGTRYPAKAQANRRPSPLSAQCSANGASRLPERLRSSQRATPARVAPAAAPITVRTVPAGPGLTRSATAALALRRPREGRTCHSPNSSDEPMTATRTPRRRASMASSTPRKATSSSSAVPSGIRTSTCHSTAAPDSAVARVSANA